jgi:hypothetical protein
MPWTADTKLDEGSNDVGLATMTWTEPTGNPPAMFPFSRRIRANAAGANAFVAAAIAARDAWQIKEAANAAGAAILLAKINAADPKAV